MVSIDLINRTTTYKHKDSNSMKSFKHTVKYVTSIPVTIDYKKVWYYFFKQDTLRVMGFKLIGYNVYDMSFEVDETLTFDENNIILEADYLMGVYIFSFDTYLETEEHYSLPDMDL